MGSIALVFLGIFAGVSSGLIGIGGGIIIVPAQVLLFGLSQQQAQGTTLALLVPPIGILAAWSYYKHGYVDMRIAVLICLGFLIGGLLGGKLATQLPAKAVTRIFGISLFLISVKMIFLK